jgi:hypothetical protein
LAFESEFLVNFILNPVIFISIEAAISCMFGQSHILRELPPEAPQITVSSGAHWCPIS